MIRFVLSLILIASISACSSTRYSAPIVEAGGARKPRPVQTPAKPKPAVQKPGFYTVQAGDTLFKIAFEAGVDYRELADWNDLADPALIRVGEVLRLSSPAPRKPAPSADKPTPRAAEKTETPTKPVAVTPPDSTEREEGPANWLWPATGEVVTRFNEAEGNKGIDVAGARGGRVLASAGGKVVYAGAGLRGYGRLVIIKHSKTLLSAYGHHERLLVKEGQVVAQGETIGIMGDSDADRVKLHFEIREYGKPVDPLGYLPKRG